jgi:sugar phosphate isomerase/epimerase
MKIGVFAVLFGDKPFEETLDYLVDLGVQAVEIGTGAYPGNAHCDPRKLLADEKQLKAFGEAVARRGLIISALSCHGNPLHPQAKIAKDHHEIFLRTIELAKKLDVGTVITFSGCPPGDESATQPNWIVSPWPPEFSDMLAWQWKERVTPYWQETARAAKAAGVKVAIEMHPNFVVYNPETMLRLVGYDHVLSIEHEDSIMSAAEGLKKAIAFLKDIVVADPAGVAYWA